MSTQSFPLRAQFVSRLIMTGRGVRVNLLYSTLIMCHVLQRFMKCLCIVACGENFKSKNSLTCHFVSFVMYIRGAKFQEHCFNIPRDIVYSVFYHF